MVALVIASGTLFTGCVEDPCAETICFNNGSCNEIDGSCDCTGNFTGPTCEDCAEGWQGTDCDEEIPAESAAFVGTYNAEENCSDPDGTLSTLLYEAGITDSSTDPTLLNLSNFSDSFFEGLVTATVSDSSITIPNQEPDGDAWFVQGTGFLDPNVEGRIRMDYTIVLTDTIPAYTLSCAVFYDKI